jgi:hypothetical protein
MQCAGSREYPDVTVSSVRLRTKVTKGPGSRAAGIAMAYKLIDAAQARWRAVKAPHLVALVRARLNVFCYGPKVFGCFDPAS